MKAKRPRKLTLDEAQTAMRRRYKPTVPVETAVVQGQLAHADGRFRFRIDWRVRAGRGPVGDAPYSNARLGTVWSAGTVEEMLHGVAAAELGLASTPGVRQEPKHGETATRCKDCGRKLMAGRTHDTAYCQAVRLHKARKKLSRGGSASDAP